MRRRFSIRAFGCLVLALTTPGGLWAAQAAPAPAATLTVAGDVTSPLSLSPADLKDMPRTKVEVTADGRRSPTRESWWARS